MLEAQMEVDSEICAAAGLGSVVSQKADTSGDSSTAPVLLSHLFLEIQSFNTTVLDRHSHRDWDCQVISDFGQPSSRPQVWQEPFVRHSFQAGSHYVQPRWCRSRYHY